MYVYTVPTVVPYLKLPKLFFQLQLLNHSCQVNNIFTMAMDLPPSLQQGMGFGIY